jgi:predicted metal-dependent hydrolase
MQTNTLPSPAHSVLLGETEIRFSLNYVDRKTLAIHVYPDGKVSVDVPLSADIEKVYGKVKKRASWILKQQRQFESYPAPLPERRYVSSETHRYLGRQYRLKVIGTGGSREDDARHVAD